MKLLREIQKVIKCPSNRTAQGDISSVKPDRVRKVSDKLYWYRWFSLWFLSFCFQIVRELYNLQNQNPVMTEVFSVGKSYEGREQLAIKVTICSHSVLIRWNLKTFINSMSRFLSDRCQNWLKSKQPMRLQQTSCLRPRRWHLPCWWSDKLFFNCPVFFLFFLQFNLYLYYRNIRLRFPEIPVQIIRFK